MRTAVLRGKVDLSEDLLTASFVDLVRVHAAAEIVRDLLALARVVDEHGRASLGSLSERIPGWERADVAAWPTWPRGEPDFVLELLDGDALVARVVVEAKIGAGKSGYDTAGGVIEAKPDEDRGDQLARYLVDAVERKPSCGCCALVYLTHHATAPRQDIVDSVRARQARGCVAPIAWASWRDVEDRLAGQVATASGPLAHDLADSIWMLRRAGLFRFRGAWPKLPSPNDLARRLFWSSARRSAPVQAAGRTFRYAGAGLPQPPAGIFWRALPARTFRASAALVAPLSVPLFYTGGA